MYSPAQDIQFINNAFDGSSPFYPGEVYSLTFENGSTIESVDWLAVLNDLDDAIPITDKYDFYSHFVVNTYFNTGLSKRSEQNEPELSSIRSSRSSFKRKRQSTPTPQNFWNNSAYPNDPVVAEPNLGVDGVLSGYFLPESSTAVLSIPNFYPGNVTTFSNTVGDFLSTSKAAGMQKVVIDLQQNYGGQTLLATDVFKQVSSLKMIDFHSQCTDSLLKFFPILSCSPGVESELNRLQTLWAILLPICSTATALLLTTLLAMSGPLLPTLT